MLELTVLIPNGGSSNSTIAAPGLRLRRAEKVAQQNSALSSTINPAPPSNVETALHSAKDYSPSATPSDTSQHNTPASTSVSLLNYYLLQVQNNSSNSYFTPTNDNDTDPMDIDEEVMSEDTDAMDIVCEEETRMRIDYK